MTSMYRQKLHLPIANAKTKRRLVEIKYYTYFESFILALDKHSGLSSDFFDIYCKMFDLESSANLKTAYAYLKMKAYRPTKYEQVIMCRYEGMSYAKIRRLLNVTDFTINRYLKRFVIEHEGILPAPIFSDAHFLVIQDALQDLRIGMKKTCERVLFLDSDPITDIEILYQGVE